MIHLEIRHVTELDVVIDRWAYQKFTGCCEVDGYKNKKVPRGEQGETALALPRDSSESSFAIS